MPSEFKRRCPNCLSADHSAYRFKIRFQDGQLLDCGPVYGSEFRHCEMCGLRFHLSNAVELRLVEPIEIEDLGDRHYV